MKRGAFRWITIFVCFTFLPTILWMFVHSVADTHNYEKRDLAPFPDYQKTGYLKFTKASEDYYKDNLPFRNYLLQIYSLTELKIFGESFSDDVIAGRNGWLFYQGEKGASTADFEGANLFSDGELGQIRQNLLDTRDYLKKRNIDFVLFIAPNKETLYGQYLPKYIADKKAEYTRVMQLLAYLKANTDIRIVYPEPEIWEETQERQTYCKLDSHWNNVGAYVGTRELLKELGVKLPPISQLTITQTNTSNKDLAGELGLTRFLNDEVNFDLSGYTQNKVTEIQGKDTGFNTYYQFQSDAEDQRTVMMCRDSFADAMIPYFAPNFKEVIMPNYMKFSVDQLKKVKPDVFVLELAERRLSILNSFFLRDSKK